METGVGEGCSLGFSRWKVVLWDFDGTVANTAPDVWLSLENAARRFGRRLPDWFASDPSNLSLPMTDICGTLLPPVEGDGVEAFEREVARQYREVSDHELTALYPGVLETIHQLQRAGALSLIVTNKPRLALERILSVKGWAQLFNGWWCIDTQVRGRQTKPDLIASALGAVGRLPSECVLVGDSATDIVSAHQKHVTAIGVTYGDGSTSEMVAANPDYLAGDGRELKEILLGGSQVDR